MIFRFLALAVRSSSLRACGTPQPKTAASGESYKNLFFFDFKAPRKPVAPLSRFRCGVKHKRRENRSQRLTGASARRFMSESELQSQKRPRNCVCNPAKRVLGVTSSASHANCRLSATSLLDSCTVNALKAVTSRRLRNEFLDLRGAYGKAVLWSRSYFAGSCGGALLEVVKQYIQHQRG
ncbi:hypothetical protein SODG_005046 [Sodalis praecaptivus]